MDAFNGINRSGELIDSTDELNESVERFCIRINQVNDSAWRLRLLRDGNNDIRRGRRRTRYRNQLFAVIGERAQRGQRETIELAERIATYVDDFDYAAADIVRRRKYCDRIATSRCTDITREGTVSKRREV